jgi:hypothetical protein
VNRRIPCEKPNLTSQYKLATNHYKPSQGNTRLQQKSQYKPCIQAFPRSAGFADASGLCRKFPTCSVPVKSKLKNLPNNLFPPLTLLPPVPLFPIQNRKPKFQNEESLDAVEQA